MNVNVDGKNIESFQQFIELEINSIREEYLNVKKCQHTFLIFEITATGVILSFLLPILLNNPAEQTFFHLFLIFAPLPVIIPSLYIIYDKGITLNRIASFLLVIEYVIYKHGRYPKLLKGWETGCLEFRSKANKLKPKHSAAATQGPNKFYVLLFYISFTLILVSIALFIALWLRSNFPSAPNLESLVFRIFFFVLPIALIAYFFNKGYRMWKKVQDEEFTILSMADLWWEILEEDENSPF